MRSERARAERNHEIRSAARSWRRAGEITAAALEEIERAYPDDSVRLAPVWSIFVFVAVFLAGLAAAIGIAIAFRLDDAMIAPTCFFAGIALCAATEIQQGRFRLASTGSDAATSLLAIGFLLIAWGVRLESGHSMAPGRTLSLTLLAAFVLFGLSAWRWGFPLYGFACAVALFVFAGRILPAARIGWFSAACLVLLATVPFLDRWSLPPSHRDALAAGLAAGLAAVYAVLNPWSVEVRWIEELSDRSPAPGGPVGARFWFFAAATLIYTLLVVVWGIRSRRRLVLDLGVAFLLVSLVTLRHYVHLAPLWVVLSAAGAAAVAAASVFERTFKRAPGATLGGFTAQPLFGKERFLSNLAVVAAAATLSPEPPAELPRSSNDFKGGGGGFGGAGASGGY